MNLTEDEKIQLLALIAAMLDAKHVVEGESWQARLTIIFDNEPVDA